ncbi:DUF4179 domain-containing protein [Brevibacillus borstelensis]|uniref:DUF4179 domain-containing protein n=2 Tax=Brevibacillus borstelensis TaxID=45462 RepID=M8D2I5_9BACL|nr:DUF4179 domain-containing protein [Brevibacillus borstelensis]EMT50444.1 hypothetical protein I532_22175 [Brevibacillus borstelensis AK1]MED1883211.1 DUF4179 domain-containing protein [Brevibacillus borstelensis]RNB65362.1 DUF4179 domain-containing protein [Brevibacillus borstelensis]WNF04857.1 DUF4179 domain-containing protein [Brevibacillus borstelensis]GED54842.1 hypothetical protein BBO01nite_40830 [Brevibacillus borstelensis]
MKCHKSDQLKPYFDGKLSPLESARLEQHVDLCIPCQEELAHIMEGTPEAEELLAEELLSPRFTELVMEDIARQEKSRNKRKTWKKRSMDIMKKTAIAVAGLTAAVTFGTMVSPTFANYVNSLFNTVKDVDGGLKQAAVEGYAQQINKQVTDKGYTVTVKEVLADPTRIALIFEIVDKDGKKLDFKAGNYEESFTLTDKAGNDLNPEGDGWARGKYGDYMLVRQDLYDIFDSVEKVPDELTVGVEFNKIMDTEGSWKLDIPIDMKKAKEVAKTVVINQEYTSPQGVVIKLDNIMTVPSASLLTLETAWNEQKNKEYRKLIEEKGWNDAPEGPRKEMRLTPGELMQYYLTDYGLAYEILDEKGNLIAGRDDTMFETLNGIRKNEVRNTSKGKGKGEGQGRVWWDGFAPFTGHEKLTFKLHSIYLNEPASFEAKISLDELSKQPVTVKNSGSTFTFSKFHLKTTEEKERFGRHESRGKGGIIEFEATLPNDIVYITDWKATDDKGNVYRMSMDNGDGEYTRDKDGRVQIKSALFISGLEKQPKELTITYGIQERQYRDLNWEVPIQLDK